MILQSLVEYYEVLDRAGEISRPGYGKANVSFALELSGEGEVLGIIPLKISVQRGKKSVEVPQSLPVPEQVKRAVNVQSNFLCDNSAYLLGLDTKGKPERTKACFDNAKELHEAILAGVESPAAQAVLGFFNQWEGKTEEEKLVVLGEYGEEILKGVNLVFDFDSTHVQEDSRIKTAWEQYKSADSDQPQMTCLITGEKRPVARLHPVIKGVRGAASMGVSVVSFNLNAFCSYGRDGQQGSNAPVSDYGAFAYGTALNALLASKNQVFIGDATVVFWALTADSGYQDFAQVLFNPQEAMEEGGKQEDHETTNQLASIFQHLLAGTPVNQSGLALDPKKEFYILGVAPNSARLAVRFFLVQDYGSFVENLLQHHRDLEIVKAAYNRPYISMEWLLWETVSPHAKDKSASPLLAGAVMRAILQGKPYPEALYSAILLRIRGEKKISYEKAAIIKAYLLRKYQNNPHMKEVITVSLNQTTTHRAYVLGRLFATLEKLQKDVSPGLNSTIKDRYFTSACANPRSVFPTLLRLSNHHLGKSEYVRTHQQRIQELMDLIPMDGQPFPPQLSLADQGIFILGYYHQEQEFYKKNEDKQDQKEVKGDE